MTEELRNLETKPRRVVSYNQDAVICPTCKKRIRLNNDGRMRAHMGGRMGSATCVGDPDQTVPQKPPQPAEKSVVATALFSDRA